MGEGNSEVKNLDKLENIQKKTITNIATAKYNDHAERILKSLKILKFTDQITLNTSKMMH